MFTFRKTWLHINLRFTLCFKWLAQGQPWKRVPTYGQPLCRTVVLKKNLSCTSYHCVRLFTAVKHSLPPSRTMCKYSALNSGASLNRGRKFITGIPSRHESCQKIRHIPVRRCPPYFNPFHMHWNPVKMGRKYFVLYLLAAICERGKDAVWLCTGTRLRSLSLSVTGQNHRHSLYCSLKVTSWVKASLDSAPHDCFSCKEIWSRICFCQKLAGRKEKLKKVFDISFHGGEHILMDLI